MGENRKIKGLFLSLDHQISQEALQSQGFKGNGIEKKIVNQYHCLEDYGFEMEMYCPFAKRPHKLHAIGRRFPLYWIFSYGKSVLERADIFDFVYVRRPWFIDGNTIFFLRRMKKRNPALKIIIEYPTYPGGTEANKLNMYPLVWKDRIWSRFIKTVADRVMTFSKDDIIDNVKTICTCNAINPELVRPIKREAANSDGKIHLIACSSMAFWHGYDRMMEGIRQYKKEHNECPLVLHLVGEGEKLNDYKDFIRKYDLGNDIITHGFLCGKQLDDVYERADIALDSLGRHRSEIYYNSSLKGKEYCAKGLPIISGVETELDTAEDFKYYLRVPADDSTIPVDLIKDFYKSVYERGKSRREVIKEISKYAIEHFSFKVSLKPVADYINGITK